MIHMEKKKKKPSFFLVLFRLILILLLLVLLAGAGFAWWFCDQRDGMQEQMSILAALGSLSSFVGMLTDSRSFVSYPRHEYFRRILCNMLGTWVENGEYPADMDTLKTIVQGICYYNAEKYFQF